MAAEFASKKEIAAIRSEVSKTIQTVADGFDGVHSDIERLEKRLIRVVDALNKIEARMPILDKLAIWLDKQG